MTWTVAAMLAGYMWGSTTDIDIHYLYDILLTSLNAKPKGEITNVIIDDRSLGCDASVIIEVKGSIVGESFAPFFFI